MPILTLSWAVQASTAEDRPMLTPHFPGEPEFGATGITTPDFCSPPKAKRRGQKRRISATWHTFVFTLSSAHNWPKEASSLISAMHSKSRMLVSR
jgi:hypothetical protein